MSKPWVLALAAGVIVLLVAFALPLLHMGERKHAAAERPAASGLPWQVTLLPEGDAGVVQSSVFGLRPGRDTLADAEARLGDAMQLALVARLGEPGTLEALVDPFAAGFVSGRLVLAFDSPMSAVLRWRAVATGSEPMEGGVRRFRLSAAEHDKARSLRLVGLSFLPTLRLSEDDVQQRFGRPTEQLAQPDGAQVLLYPALGLSVTVAPGRRGVLQYVAPAEFAQRLRGPLRAAQSAGAASSSGVPASR